MTTNSASDVTLPTMQQANIQPTLQQLPTSISQLSGQTMGPAFNQLQTQLYSPTAAQAMAGAQSAAQLGMPIGNQMVQTGQEINQAGMNIGQQAAPIFPYAQQVFQTGMDPQNQLYQWLQNQNQQQTAATNAMAGVGTTPYGADLMNQSNMLFNINWQNQQLQRQIAALQSGTSAIQTGTGIEATGAGVQQAGIGLEAAAPAFEAGTSAIPYATRSQITGTNLGDITQYINQGQVPITDLLSLLTGQNQSNQVANQTAGLGLTQSALEMQQLAGLVGGASSLAGGFLGGTTGTGVSGLSSLGSGANKLAGNLFGPNLSWG